MANRKPISVNLRDLQRILNEGKPEMPRFSSGVAGNNEEDDERQQNASFGPTRNKSGSTRWANEAVEDDFDPMGSKETPNDKPEPDFSTVRNTDNEFARSDSKGRSGSRNSRQEEHERKPEDDVWRNTNAITIQEDSAEDDFWRRPSSNISSDKSRRDDWTAKEDDDMFNRATLQRENSGKKLYVPPSRKFDNAFGSDNSSEPTTSRFSCLDTGYDMRSTGSSNYESSRAKEVFSMQRRDSDSKDYGSHYSNDAFKDLNRENSRSSIFKEQHKPGAYVPINRRTQAQTTTITPRNSTVHDIFLKAAKITESRPAEDKKKVEAVKDVQQKPLSQAELLVQQKRQAILRHNRMYEFKMETIQQVETSVKNIIQGVDVDLDTIVPEDEEELVPAVVACLVTAKACEECNNMEQVKNMFNKVAPLLSILRERSEHDITGPLLTEMAKIICEWKLPAISTSVYLIEAVFDALVQTKVVTTDTAIQWIEDVPSEVPDRINVILQVC
eukprot:XP_001611226.1 hypothetical protein [Babesia bovis T2Bo]